MGRGHTASSAGPPQPSAAWSDTRHTHSHPAKRASTAATSIRLQPKGMTWVVAKRPKQPAAEPAGCGEADCICTICTCNHHACPRHVEKDYSISGPSGYREDYRRHPNAPPPPQRKPTTAPTLSHARPSHFETTMALSYQDPGVAPPPAMATQQAQRLVHPFTSTTTHRADYTPKPAVPKQPRPQSRALPMLPLNCTSVAHEAFQDWTKTATRTLPVCPHHTPPKKTPFDAVTTYRQDFREQNHRAVRPKAMPPPHAEYHPAEGFLADTEYRHCFQPKPIHACVVPFLPPHHAGTTGHHHYALRPTPDADPFNPKDWEPAEL